jgi:hypothetical protein
MSNESVTKSISLDEFLRLSRESFGNGYREGLADGLLGLRDREQMRADKYIAELRELYEKAVRPSPQQPLK